MDGPALSRRQLLLGLLAAGAAGALGGCRSADGAAVDQAAVDAAEAARPHSGQVRSASLVARPATVDLGGPVVDTWAYGDRVPGAPLRLSAGDELRVAFGNELPEATSVHWHGLAIRNDMDGVPGLTTPQVLPGGSFEFRFVVPDPGTYWLHPHHGLQLDRGLYAPLIVDDPDDPGDYDSEWVLVLDDWTDGLGARPEQIYAELRRSGGGTGMAGTGAGGMGGMGMGGTGSGGTGMSGTGSGAMGMSGTGTGGSGGTGPGGLAGTGGTGGMGGMTGRGAAGDVAYPLYLVNGRSPADPDVLIARPGQRLKLRVINAAADTVFDLALGGHRLSVTHTDGLPVVAHDTAAVRLGMGERYDAVVTLADGVFPLVAAPVGKAGLARALVRTASGEVPPADSRPDELADGPLVADVLSAAPGAALPRRAPDTVQDVVLAGSMRGYVWTINGRSYDDTEPLTISAGQTGRLRIRNHSMTAHPVHLHGHSFQLGPAGGSGARKDTILVAAMGGVDVDLAAANPGTWLLHCHNAYHGEAGMMTRLEYRS